MIRTSVLTIGLLGALAIPVSEGATAEPSLPPFIMVTDHGKVGREGFPVSGSIPLHQGALADKDLARLSLLSGDGKPVPAQFGVAGRWLDGSIKWLLLDFASTQAAGSPARYTLRLEPNPSGPLEHLAQATTAGIKVNTGTLLADFGEKNAAIHLLRDGNRQTIIDGEIVSRIGVKGRGSNTANTYTLNLGKAVIESNGPLRTVLKIEGWHQSENGDRFSPSVIRLIFCRGQSFVRIQHTFVNSKDPDKHLITDMALEIPLQTEMTEAVYSSEGKPQAVALNGKPLTILQENIARPTYPPGAEFKGRFRVVHDGQALAEGSRYPGGLVLRRPGAGLGVFVKDMWQMSPKALSYVPATRRLRIGLWPSEAGDLELMRTEVKKPDHYQAFARNDPLYRDPKFGPTYVPHDLAHSAMGLSRTHEAVLWFALWPGSETPATPLDPVELAKQFSLPFVPFVSGEWNAATGVMGKHVTPGRFRGDLQAVNAQVPAELWRQIEKGGWYGMLSYGNVHYAYDKEKMTWMHYHPKFSWYNSGHLMEGGTMLEALWFQYLRSGNPYDYLLAEARGRSVMDTSTVHYHDDPRLIGAMIRHGGFDPWTGNRCQHGAHAPLCGIPLQHYITGCGRARDVTDLVGRKNYQGRNFNHGRDMDTDINTMMEYYHFTLDPKYFQRAVEYVDHYRNTLDQARTQLTYIEYFTTALRKLYDATEDKELRRKVQEIYQARYANFAGAGRVINLEMAGFAYELAPTAENARQLEQAVERWTRLCSGQLGWSDNMVLRGMNDIARMNAVCYALYWLEQTQRDAVQHVAIHPDGGTFAKQATVTLSTATPGAAIRFTLDATPPTEQSPLYQGPLTIDQDRTLKAAAFLTGKKASPAGTAAFTFNGVALPREKLELWFRADTGTRLDGKTVLEWFDQSGNGRHALAAASASAPLVGANRLNGLPVVQGEPGKFLRLRRLVPLPGDCTVIFFASFTGPAAAVVGDGDDGWIGMDKPVRGELHVRFSVGEASLRPKLPGPYELGGFSVWTLIRQGNRVMVYRDGKEVSSSTPLVSTGSPMILGLLFGMRPLAQNFKGELAELLVFSTALVPADRIKLEQYLSDKHGRRQAPGK